MSILITGFEPIDDRINASRVLIESLRAKSPKHISASRETVNYVLLPSKTDEVQSALLAALENYEPEYCIMTGQTHTRNKLTIERFATNLRDFKIPDGAGQLRKNSEIVRGAPIAYRSTVSSVNELVNFLNKNHIPSEVSNFAGNHICNQAFYNALHYAATYSLKTKVSFVHILPLPDQVIDEWPDSSFMPLPMTRMAIDLIFRYLANEL